MELFEVISSVILVANFIWTIFNYFAIKKQPFKQNNLKKVTKYIFIPCYFSLEKNLFQKITKENKREIYANLIELNKIITENQLQFYLNDALLISLKKCIHCFSKEKISFTTHFRYIIFSTNYWKNLNRARADHGLIPRSLIYRIQLGLVFYPYLIVEFVLIICKNFFIIIVVLAIILIIFVTILCIYSTLIVKK